MDRNIPIQQGQMSMGLFLMANAAGLVGLFVGLLRGRALWWWMNENIKNNPLRFKNKYPMLK